jgi:putative flippase GtrA
LTAESTAVGVEKEIFKLETQYPVLKTFRFAIAGAIGFVVTELVLTIGLLTIYGKLSLPHASFTSPALLLLDIISLVIGVSASFLINERITVKAPKAVGKEVGNRFFRFLKFQAVSGVGNAGIIVVQLLLLASFEISPLFGTIIGAIVTYPIVYYISIKFVWKAQHIR